MAELNFFPTIENVRFVYSNSGNKRHLKRIWEDIMDDKRISLVSELKCIKAVNSDFGYTFGIPNTDPVRIAEKAYGFLLKVYDGFDVRSIVKTGYDIMVVKMEDIKEYIERNGGYAEIFDIIQDKPVSTDAEKTVQARREKEALKAAKKG